MGRYRHTDTGQELVTVDGSYNDRRVAGSGVWEPVEPVADVTAATVLATGEISALDGWLQATKVDDVTAALAAAELDDAERREVARALVELEEQGRNRTTLLDALQAVAAPEEGGEEDGQE